jgi:hypothetical protein
MFRLLRSHLQAIHGLFHRWHWQLSAKYTQYELFFWSDALHVHIHFVVPTPGCGRSVTDFWGWRSHRARLRCPDDVSDDMCECGVPGGALNLNSTGYPDHGRCGDLPLQGKFPTAEPGIKHGASCLVVKSSDHKATRLVRIWIIVLCIAHS